MRLVALCLLVSPLGFAVACARALPDAALTPRATVAAVGYDVLDVSTSSDVPPLGAESLPVAPPPQHEDAPLTLDVDADAAAIEVRATDAERVTVRVTAVSLGEALAFLAGGRLVGAPDLVRILTAPSGDAGPLQRRLELSALVEQGTGLLSIVAEAAGGEAPAQVRTLVQMGPLRLQAEARGEDQVHVALTDAAGEPIAGAAIELLDADGRVLSEALTGSGGHAVLEALVVPPLPPAVLGVGLFVAASFGGAHALVELP